MARMGNWFKTQWKGALFTGVVLVVIALVGGVLIGRESLDEDDFRPSVPPGGAAEFLYLDAARVATYLAQVEG